MSGLGNPSTAGRTVTINIGGTLQFGIDNIFGGPQGAAPNIGLVINAGGAVLGYNGNMDTLGTVTLNGGTLSTNNGDNAANESLYIKGGTVSVGGTSPSLINTIGTTNTGIQLASSTTFNVAATGGMRSGPDRVGPVAGPPRQRQRLRLAHQDRRGRHGAHRRQHLHRHDHYQQRHTGLQQQQQPNAQRRLFRHGQPSRNFGPAS